MKSLKLFAQRFSFFIRRLGTLRIRIEFQTATKTKRRKNPDWSRISEPDTFIQPFTLLIYELLITVTAGMINYTFATPGSLETAIARFLVPYIKPGQSFWQTYAVFTFALVALIEMIAFTFIASIGEPDHHDLAGMILSLDESTQSHISDLDETTNSQLDQISKDISDFTPL